MTQQKKNHRTIPFSFDDAVAYVEALKTPWRTMHADMDAARAIIAAQTDEPVAVIDKVEQVANALHFSFPDWHGPLEAHFVNRYGKSEGSFIFDKVIMHLFKQARSETRQLH